MQKSDGLLLALVASGHVRVSLNLDCGVSKPQVKFLSDGLGENYTNIQNMYSSYSLTIERFRLVSPFPASPTAYLLSELAQDAFLQPLFCINLSSKSIQVLCQSSNLQSGRGRRAANTKTNQHCVNHSDVSEVAHNSTSCSASASSAAVAGSISRHTRSSCLATACDTRCWNWANCSAQREARLSVIRNRHDPTHCVWNTCADASSSTPPSRAAVLPPDVAFLVADTGRVRSARAASSAACNATSRVSRQSSAAAGTTQLDSAAPVSSQCHARRCQTRPARAQRHQHRSPSTVCRTLAERGQPTQSKTSR